MAKIDRAEIKALAKDLNESTRLSWLWAILFGPFYYAANGLWSQALVIFLLALVCAAAIPLLLPFVWIGGGLAVYSTWRGKAEKEARRAIISRATA